MRLVERFWTAVTYVVSLVTFSGVETPQSDVQAPVLSAPSFVYEPPGPIFSPPTGTRGDVEGSDFKCDYTAMKGWTNCSTPDNRGCWLKHSDGREFNIETNYEDLVPIGVERVYYLNVLDGRVNADGIWFEEAKLFNNEYPGPWIQACWGDTVKVIVNNLLHYNGTSVHWHGIRQWNSVHMDGVNGVTQCPIAPQDRFVYKWEVRQYGTAWYHSHYSAQYADGLVGPMTLHGPSSANYDEAKFPILMTDWGHNSAFNAIHSGTLNNQSILLNGRGNVSRYYDKPVATEEIPKPETYYFTRKADNSPKRYLMRLINTAFDTTFVFSIDHHLLQVIGADFVPIKPYDKRKSILVGIGQRYHVIVTAEPMDVNGVKPPEDGNFWMRTWIAGCFNFQPPQDDKGNVVIGYERTGIIRYDNKSKTDPQSKPWYEPPETNFECADEPYEEFHPMFNWTVGPPANAPKGSNFIGEIFNVTLKPRSQNPKFPLGKWSMAGTEFNPLQISYANPTMLHLTYPGPWNPLWAVFPENQYTAKDWLYMVILGSGRGNHPIHLHGHDFAILKSVKDGTYPPTTDEDLNLKLENPARRDVVLLPNNGYIIIAFKADNPGPWLMHCHIADHASQGLAMQIMERQGDANKFWPTNSSDPTGTGKVIQDIIDGCNNWNQWWGDCRNWWSPDGEKPGFNCKIGQNGFADDSGI